MANTAILSVRILGDAAGAVQAFGETERRAGAMQRGMDRASAAAALAMGGIVAAAGSAAQAASEAQQAVGAVESVFGTSADAVLGYARDASTAVGLSASSYNELASVLGAQLGNMGMAGDELAGQTDELITLGSDLAATFGGTTADAVSALSSLMRGERDPIERFGVSMNQAAIDAQMAEMGLEGLTGEAARNAQAQATLALLTEQTANAQGQFAREADTAAGQAQIMTAEWENAQAALGEQLLPYLVQGSQLLGEFAGWVQQNQGLVTGLVVALAAVATTILLVNAGMKAYAAVQAIIAVATKAQTIAQGIATAAQWAFNAAAAANPMVLIIMAIIIAIGLVVAAVIWLWNNWDSVTTWIGQAIDNIVAWWNDLVVSLGIDDVINAIGEAFQAVGDWVGDVVGGMIDWVADLVGWISDAVGWLGSLVGLNNDAAASASSAQSAQSRVNTVQPMSTMLAPSVQRMTTFAAPQTFAAAQTSNFMASANASSQQPLRAGDTYNITVNGAIDKDGTARTILDALRTHERRTGRRVTAGGAW